MKVRDWLKYGVHHKEYNECTEDELKRLRKVPLSPHTIGELLKKIDVLLEGEL